MESAPSPSAASAVAAATAADPPSSDAVNGCSGLGDGDDGACEQGKLFVGGIPWDATEEALRDYFGKYGQVVEVIIMKDRVTGNPRGFGFVSFVDPSSADMAIQDTSVKHSILGRLVSSSLRPPSLRVCRCRACGCPPKALLFFFRCCWGFVDLIASYYE